MAELTLEKTETANWALKDVTPAQLFKMIEVAAPQVLGFEVPSFEDDEESDLITLTTVSLITGGTDLITDQDGPLTFTVEAKDTTVISDPA